MQRTLHSRRHHLARRARLAGALFPLLVLALAAACGKRITEPLPEIGATEFEPLPQYALWWDMAQSCSGLRRDMAEIRWLTDPSSSRRTIDGGTDTVVGEWYAGSSSIVLTREYLSDPGVVRHEMLHALLHDAGHPAPVFRDGCSGYVVCEGSCARSAGPLPPAPPLAPRVPVESLTIRQSIAPAKVRLTNGDAWFALVVEATNARSHPVWVRLRPFAGRPGVAATFGYATAETSHQNEIAGDSVSFAAGETKRYVFDLTVKQYLAESRSPVIRGFFNAVTLPELPIQIEP